MSEIVVVVRPRRGSEFTIELTRLVERAATMARQLEWISDEQEFVELLADLEQIGDADIDRGPRES